MFYISLYRIYFTSVRHCVTMSVPVEQVVKTYRSLCQIPALVGAKQLLNNVVTSVWTQRNLDKGKTTKFQRSHIISLDSGSTLDVPVPIDISNQLLTCLSPSKKLSGVVRDIDSKQFLEVWGSDSLKRSVDLKSLDIHGDVYTDGEFASFEFSPDETKLIYVAEKKPPKTESFLKRSPNKKSVKDENDGEIAKGEEFLYKQDWGEQLVGKIQSIIVLYDIECDAVRVLEGIPDNVCPAQPIWSPDGSYVVGIAYKTHPRKLGLMYCTNRLSTIFKSDFEGNYSEFNIVNKSVKCPRFALDGNTLIWLQRTAGGPHGATMTLVKTELPLSESPKIDTIIDLVETEIKITNDKSFYGLYNSGFIPRCWASDRRLLLSTNQKTTINSYVVDIDSGSITELEFDSGSQVVLDVSEDVILVNRRNLLKGDILAIGKLPEKGEEANIKWTSITESSIVPGLESCVYEYIDLVQDADDAVKSFTAIYVGPKSGPNKSVPLILWPHGGPHGNFTNNLFLEASFFASFGYGIVLVNFRGSTGTGQASVDFLLGRIGTSDVADCILTTKNALERYSWLNPNAIALVGGSHGGFLVTHLSGQYPDKYKAVVARNPVIDVASMSVISDIPDWCSVEAGGNFTQIGERDKDLLQFMIKNSPIEHAHKVRAPTLLQVGSKDVRVPPHQSFEYYHRLKANGVNVKMHLYDDNHPLGNVSNEADNLINSLLWIQEHLNM